MADNTLPTPERRAELRHSIAVGKAFGMKDGGSNLVYGIELEPLLDATEPVADAEVARIIEWLRESPSDEWCATMLNKAAALIERLARQVAEAKALMETLRDIAEGKVVK
jgi:hypothetical protein